MIKVHVMKDFDPVEYEDFEGDGTLEVEVKTWKSKTLVVYMDVTINDGNDIIISPSFRDDNAFDEGFVFASATKRDVVELDGPYELKNSGRYRTSIPVFENEETVILNIEDNGSDIELWAIPEGYMY